MLVYKVYQTLNELSLSIGHLLSKCMNTAKQLHRRKSLVSSLALMAVSLTKLKPSPSPLTTAFTQYDTAVSSLLPLISQFCLLHFYP